MQLDFVFTILTLVFLEQETFANDSPSGLIEDSTVAGKACLKMANDSFFRARELYPDQAFSPWILEVVDNCDREMRWYIEYYKDKVRLFMFCVQNRKYFQVALKPEWLAFEFLIFDDEGSVSLATWPELNDKLWAPYKNKDGSWSFQSAHGGWLSVDENGTISADENATESSRNFRLESREGPLFIHYNIYHSPFQNSHSIRIRRLILM